MNQGKYIGVQDGKVIFAEMDAEAAEQRRRADCFEELLAACESALSALRSTRDNCPEEWDVIVNPELMNAWDLLKAAINKARKSTNTRDAQRVVELLSEEVGG